MNERAQLRLPACLFDRFFCAIACLVCLISED